MLGIVATFNVLEGKNTDFENLMLRTAAIVSEKEPDVLLYKLLKSRKDPQTYYMMENYLNQAAFDAHISEPHIVELVKNLPPLLASRMILELADEVQA